MATSEHLKLGSALTDELNAVGAGTSPLLGMAFTACFALAPKYELKDLIVGGPPLVEVVPGGFTTEPSSRGQSNEMHAFCIAIHAKLEAAAPAPSPAMADPYLLLLESIINFFRNRRLANYAAVFSHAASVGDPASATPYLMSGLRERGELSLIVKLWFRRTA